MASKLNPNVLYVPGEAGEESSDSDGEQEETSHKLIRKVSTSGQIRAKKSVKEGILLKQTSSFQRWKRRYFKLRGRTLYYAKDCKSLIFDEVDLSDASVAETSTKNINNSFTVITPFRKLMLCAESRKEMEDWITALKSVQKWETYEASQFNMEHFSGMHNWYACSHARPTFCNVCREALPGVTSHGLSCEVSIIPPTALNSIDSDGFWKATSASCSSPLLVLVNSKSGDNQGVKFLRKFKQLLNPAQVFDLMNGGPELGLRLFQKFVTFRILVCGGDGSVGWVLSELDKLNLHKQVRTTRWTRRSGLEVMKIQLKLKVIHSSTFSKVIQWSVMTYEVPTTNKQTPIVKEEDCIDSPLQVHITQYADSVASHLAKILDSDKHSDVISSAKFLCGTVNDFVAEVGKAYERATENKEEADAMAKKCALLNEKLDSLVKALSEEAEAQVMTTSVTTDKTYRSKEQLMLRANSLKKALRQIIEQAEKVVDEQNRHTQVQRMSSSSSIKRENSEELKDAEPRQGSLSPTSPIVLEKPESLNTVTFSEDSVQCSEKCVMNNYFGIGLDAKISLEFNNKRDEHPKKCSSRTKNMMWYGVLGTKELVQKTYKNLEQRVQLECDGVPMSLPSLQGLAVLNIPSYAGGINFWGGTKEDNNFGAPSFDDKKLEVVAVFGSMQMAMSRVINLQHHRIAQCRQVKITILGEEGVPVQVDGEAWIQPPGIVKIIHKNRAQMLTRDRAFESTLKSWEDKRKIDSYRASRPRLNSQQSMEYLTEEECAQVQQLGIVADTLINKIREAAKTHKLVEQELAHAVNATALVLTEAKLSSPECLSRSTAVEIVNSSKVLQAETRMLLDGKLLVRLSQREELRLTLNSLSAELHKLDDIHWICPLMQCTEEQSATVSLLSSMKLKIIPKGKKEREKLHKQKSNSSLSGTWDIKGGTTEADSSGN
uniref:Diacylglycerol kinase n=1 Tax=Neolamprologus brichardi TaxID=32507 RepID=A0A3Q4HR86_NEOBR